MCVGQASDTQQKPGGAEVFIIDVAIGTMIVSGLALPAVTLLISVYVGWDDWRSSPDPGQVT
jgi:hypothetical protein